MEVIYSNLAMKQWVNERDCGVVGFVPTMGALHKGHLSLVEQANKQCDIVVVSIFVNPTQFNNTIDLKKYPTKIDEDLELLRKSNVNMVFAPDSIEEVYANEKPVVFEFESINNVMEGKFRNGHFEGVGRVVKLLLELIEPNFAFFGEKDFQQLLIIKKMVDQFEIETNIIGCETVREADGLAMSSRNLLLDLDERKKANQIYKALKHCRESFNINNMDSLEKKCFDLLKEFSDPEYFEIRKSKDLSKKGGIQDEWRAFVASKVGSVRLIDNIALN